jgi:hypothetical protein
MGDLLVNVLSHKMVVFSRTKFTYLVYFAEQEGAIKYKLITNQYKKGWTIFFIMIAISFRSRICSQ